MTDARQEIIDLVDARQIARSGLGRSVRLAASLSLREVARAVDASPSGVLRWETGQRMPRDAAGVRWARFIRGLLESQGKAL